MYSSSSNKRPSSLANKESKSQKVIQPVNMMASQNSKGYLSTSPSSALQNGSSQTHARESDSANGAKHGASNYKNHNINSHSVGRDLQAMGLITQVKQGEDVPTVMGVNGSSISYHPQPSPLATKHFGIDPSASNEYSSSAQNRPLLKPQKGQDINRKTLVLDLDETLVHSSFKATKKPDIVLPVDIEGRICHVYILVRPGCVKFLNEMAKHYEVVIYTASLSKYADPLMDILDQNRVAPQRLFREHCTFYNGLFVKDMSRIGRKLSDAIIIDNSPQSYMFQPENGMPILSWYEDRDDTKLLELIPVLKAMAYVNDVRPVILDCTTRDNKFQCEKALNMCERLIKEMQPTVPPPYYKGGNDNDSYRNITSNRVGTEMAKITVEDGPEINKSDQRRLNNMQSNANERLQVRNMSNVAHSPKNNENGEGKQERGNSLNYPHNDKKLVNTWVSGGFQDSSTPSTVDPSKLQSQTPIVKAQDLLLSQYNAGKTNKKESDNQLRYTQPNGSSMGQKTRDSLRTSQQGKRPESTGKSSSQIKEKEKEAEDNAKRRPKTAAKDNSQLRSGEKTSCDQTKQKPTASPNMFIQYASQQQNQKSFSPIQTESRKTKPVSINQQSLNFLSSKDHLMSNTQTPQHISSKLSQVKKQTPVRQSSANSTNNTSNHEAKKARAQTTKTSSRNSVERDKEDKKIDRATSSKKRPLLTKEETMAQQVTPQSSKNYGVSTFLSNLNKNGMESTSPTGQSLTLHQQAQQQYYTPMNAGGSYKSQQLDTPPGKSQVAFMNKLNQQAYSPMIVNNKYSSQKKGTKPSHSQDTRGSQEQTDQPQQQEGNALHKHMAQESTRSILGLGYSNKSPGKIFNFADKNGKAGAINGMAMERADKQRNGKGEDGYSVLLKNGSAQSIKGGANLRISTANEDRRANQNQNAGSHAHQQEHTDKKNIKGVKIINNQNALLVNKYSNAIQQQSMNNTYQYEKEQYAATNSSAKNSKINNILNDFEKTKNFNKQLLKNIGSPKGPIFARANGQGNQDESQSSHY